MLKHGRAGVPMEVMGLMLGEFVDEYTIQVIDVFAMPQSGTTVSVESVDHVFQAKMLEMLKQTGRCAFLFSERHLGCVARLISPPDQKWSSAGIIRTRASGAGCRVLMSRHNKFVLFSFFFELVI